MSGVFGFIDPSRKVDANTISIKMVKSMSHREWYISDSYIDIDKNLAIGRLGIGLFNQNRQPIVNRNKDIYMFITGEFYNLGEISKVQQGQTEEEALITLFEEQGKMIFTQLVGSFVAIVLDLRDNQIVLATDRFGTYPVYYHFESGKLVISEEVKGILCDPTIEAKLDFVALAQYMRFQHILGTRTFFEGIRRVPTATLMVYDLSEKQIHLNSYWDYSEIPPLPSIDFDEAVEETGRLFRKAVARLTQGSLRPGVYLSGGLDSRSILGMVERRPVVSINYGHQNCRDSYYARKIATAVGSDHHWFDFPNGNWIKEYADFHLELTEGFHSWIHMHGISTLKDARQWMDVNLSGWDGGLVMGHPDNIEPLQTSPVDELALSIRTFECFNQKFTWPSITEAEERFLYTSEVYSRIRGIAIDSLREELTPFLAYRPEVRCEYFMYENHNLRLTQNMIVFMRSHLDVRFPFFDYDFFNFVYSLPIRHRAAQKLYRAMIHKEMPKLALIPYDHDELLPTSSQFMRNAHRLLVRAKKRFNRSIYPLFSERFTLYADYENYLRTDLKDWAEELLFQPRFEERNIFNMDFIRSIFARHVSGQELWTIGKIAPIMSYEMMLRKLYD